MATLVQDNFTRADSTTTVGAPAVGSAPTVYGTWGIVSNTLYNQAQAVSGEEYCVWDAGVADVDFTIDVTGFNTQECGIVLRNTDASNTNLLTLQSTQSTWFSQVAGTFTQFSSFSAIVVPTRPFTIKLRCIGIDYWVYIGGVLQGYWQFPRYSTNTKFGVRVNGAVGTATSPRYDNLLIENAPTMPFYAKTGVVLDDDNVEGGGIWEPNAQSGWVYKGRAAKTDDTTGAT